MHVFKRHIRRPTLHFVFEGKLPVVTLEKIIIKIFESLILRIFIWSEIRGTYRYQDPDQYPDLDPNMQVILAPRQSESGYTKTLSCLLDDWSSEAQVGTLRKTSRSGTLFSSLVLLRCRPAV